MSEYDDIATIDRLHAEQAQLHQALVLLDDHDGIVTMFNISPPPPAPGGPPPVLLMAATVQTVGPKQNLMAAAHAYCTQRYNDINKELRDLGITGTPPDAAGPPVAATQPAREKVRG